MERRRARRRQEFKWLLIFAGLLAGLLFGWYALGWVLFPLRQSDPRDLNANSRLVYIQLAVDSWTQNHDDALAQERLRGFDPQEVAAVLRDLASQDKDRGQPQQAAAVNAFAARFGTQLQNAAVSIPPTVNPSATPPATLPPNPMRLAIAAEVTGTLRSALEKWATAQNDTLAHAGENADLAIGYDAGSGAALLAERVFVVADRFPTLRTNIALSEVRGLWQGQATHDGARSVLVTDDAYTTMARLYGPPAASVQVLPFDSIVARLWTDHNALAIVPFDELTPKLAALDLDGVNVLLHDFKLEQYPLVMRTYVAGNAGVTQAFITAVRPTIPVTNRDPDRITTLIMTGTTAIARTSAFKIEQKQDPALPARVVAPVLAAADITHVSNEISFMDNCKPVLNTMAFCSSPSYMATFKLAGVKIVGLTGNHLVDFGPAPFLKTLDMYDTAGLKYYGGGRNADQARQTLFMNDHGNKLAFLGANSFGPTGDWATADRPGSNKYVPDDMKKQIEAARAQADVVFVELQAEENYDYQPTAFNRTEFRATMAAGADVVTGVQAHHPQAIEFSGDGHHIILYGLGNLFFDQMFDIGVRQGIVARHTIYQGRLLQTELLTTMLEDYVQPRWATPAERAQILNPVFSASGFQ